MAVGRAENNSDDDQVRSNSSSLTGMSEDEMSQHLALCLKLDAENKINTKNAFGLHLIDIMRHKIKQDAQDLQSASLALQASSKIYSSRVDALYKDTYAFHNQLQTIVSNKNVKDIGEALEEPDLDEEPREKRRATKAKQGKNTYLVSEESITLKSENACQRNKMPHANFIAIKSAFAASRKAPKLLDRLPLENDSCKLFCTAALPCYKPPAPMPVQNFLYPAKMQSLLQKIINVRPNIANNESSTLCSDVFLQPTPRSPLAAPDMDPPLDDSFCIGASPPREQDADVEDIIGRMSGLDITADVLVKDLSCAIVDGNTLDRSRLPPTSTLKKVLNTVDIPKSTKKQVRKERPPREPFFNRAVDASILKKGRKIELTDNDISKWKLKDTTQVSDGCEQFSTLLADSFDDNKEVSKKLHEMIQGINAHFDRYWCKKSQLWNKYGKHRNTQLIRPSSFGMCLMDNESNQIASENSDQVLESFQILSLQNSPRSDDYDAGDDNMPDPCEPDDSFVLQPQNPWLQRSGLYEDDLKSVMVTPPEMAQPIIMRFETQPITVSTERVKNAIWKVIEKGEVVLSEVHKEVQSALAGEYLPLQFVFTTLLILANEKCLLLENISESEIKITKDILE